MASHTCIIQKVDSANNGPSYQVRIENEEAKSQKPRHESEDGYMRYSFANRGTVSINLDEKRVAVSKLEWLILRGRCKDADCKWLILSLSLCISLLFSTICLIGTASFQQDGQILWLPLLAALLHISGCAVFGVLSIYFWQRTKRPKQDLVYEWVKRNLDNELEIHSDSGALSD